MQIYSYPKLLRLIYWWLSFLGYSRYLWNNWWVIFQTVALSCYTSIMCANHFDSLVQDCSISIANALEIRQSCNKPSICDFHTLFVVWWSSVLLKPFRIMALALGQSYMALGQSYMALGQSYMTLGQSYMALGQSFMTLGQSFMALRQYLWHWHWDNLICHWENLMWH